MLLRCRCCILLSCIWCFISFGRGFWLHRLPLAAPHKTTRAIFGSGLVIALNVFIEESFPVRMIMMIKSELNFMYKLYYRKYGVLISRKPFDRWG